MCRQNHGIAADYYAMGVIAYECMIGRVINLKEKFSKLPNFQRPYQGKNRKEIRDQILAKQVQIKKNEIPPGWSLDAADIINKVLLANFILFINTCS